MKMKLQRSSKTESMVLLGIALAAAYWIIESLLFFFASPDVNFLQQLLGADMNAIWTRILVICLFAIFGSHVQYTMEKQRKTDEALRASEEKHRTIIENIQEGYLEIDLKGTLTFVNEPLCRLAGYTREELIGMNYRDFASSDQAKKMFDVFTAAYQNEKPAIDHYELTIKDGSEKVLEVSGYLIVDPEGRKTGFRGMVRDFTERIKAEKEKKKLENRLQQAQKMEAIGSLAGGIAHDFNNILMGVQGNVSLVLLRMDPEDPVLEKLKNIELYVQNGAQLTRQLLGFARGGKYEVKVTDLNALTLKTVQMFGRTKKEIRIHTKNLKPIWPVEVDQGQIEQVLLNLFVNAWQAMPGGGDMYLLSENVTLSGNQAKSYKLEPGSYVKLSVIDTGIGMDHPTQMRVFEPFFTTKERGRGTGLGLASAYGIIKNHGGQINVYSESGEGTTFNIYLPASEKALVEEKTVSKGEILRGSETILLADDEDMILDVAHEILESLGYNVLVAHGGRQAVEIYRSEHKGIHLVILDMVMPDLGGGETYEKLKAINPKVKALLSSGYSLSGRASKILEQGCDGFIQKPFDIKQLSQKIREILDAPASSNPS